MTKSIQATITETNRKREIQKKYNKMNNIIPTTLKKKITPNTLTIQNKKNKDGNYSDLEINNLSQKELKKLIRETSKSMNSAATSMNFLVAAEHRDYLFKLQKKLKYKN
jgi:excinuclease ABC subunit B